METPKADKTLGDGTGKGGSYPTRDGGSMPHLHPAGSSAGGTVITGRKTR